MDESIHHIYKDLHQELRKFIFSKVKDTDTSNDLLQEVFLKIHANIHMLTDCTKLTSWVYQITRNVIADFFRKKNVEVQIEGIDLPEDEAEEPLYQSLSTCINSKISQLPKKYKQAIFLTTFKNYSQIALAEELNISYSGAKTRVQRAREKLKNLMVNCSNVETNDKGNIIAYYFEKEE